MNFGKKVRRMESGLNSDSEYEEIEEEVDLDEEQIITEASDDVEGQEDSIDRVLDQADDDKEETVHVCKICGFIAKLRIGLLNHIKRVHGDEYLRCQICSFSSKYKGNLVIHYKNLHKIESTSDIRGIDPEFSRYPAKIGLKRKSKEKTEKPAKNGAAAVLMRCKICPLITTYKSSLKSHYKRQHGIDCDEEVKRIDPDFATYSSRSYLETAKKVKKKKDAPVFKDLRCQMCDKRYNVKRALYRHYCRHHQLGSLERIRQVDRHFDVYQGSIKYMYKKSVSNDNNNNNSERLKNNPLKKICGKRQLQCKKCDRKLRSKKALYCHYKSTHKIMSIEEIHEIDGDFAGYSYFSEFSAFECLLCGMKCLYSLSKHLKSVHGVKWTDIRYSASFRKIEDEEELNRIRQKLEVCELCDNFFMHKKRLAAHYRNGHGLSSGEYHRIRPQSSGSTKTPRKTGTKNENDEKSTCQICLTHFTTRSNLKRHFWLVHKVDVKSLNHQETVQLAQRIGLAVLKRDFSIDLSETFSGEKAKLKIE